jgi:hypothetical protein
LANLDVAVGALGVAIVLILWSIDKWFWSPTPLTSGKKVIAGVFALVGLFWLYVAWVAVTA